MHDQATRPPKVRAKKRKLKLPPNVVPHRDKFRGKVRVNGRLFQSPASRNAIRSGRNCCAGA